MSDAFIVVSCCCFVKIIVFYGWTKCNSLYIDIHAVLNNSFNDVSASKYEKSSISSIDMEDNRRCIVLHFSLEQSFCKKRIKTQGSYTRTLTIS